MTKCSKRVESRTYKMSLKQNTVTHIKKKNSRYITIRIVRSVLFYVKENMRSGKFQRKARLISQT